MRIATWNINGLRARLDFMKLWLAGQFWMGHNNASNPF
jgi:exonuclease III